MNRIIALGLAVLLSCTIGFSPASADTVSVNGTVVSSGTEQITAPAGGTVGRVHAAAGDSVKAGDLLVTLETDKVRATEDGTVRFFGEAGDSADALTEQYGGAAFVEPARRYTVSASTKQAYNDAENKDIHLAETVYLKSSANSRNAGIGIVTAASGSSFTVEVTGGTLENGEAVYVFRSPDYATSARIGRGTVSRRDPTAYSGSGTIVTYRVENGSKVRKGDVLFETLPGSCSGDPEHFCEITAEEDGVIASVSVNRGASLAAGDPVAEFYAKGDLRIQAEVSEEYLRFFGDGAGVVLTFTYLDGGAYTLKGTVEKTGRIASSVNEETGEASYAVLILPESPERLYYGMNATVTAERGT